MNAIRSAILIMIMAIPMVSCNAQKKDTPKSAEPVTKDIRVYYFHFTRRCPTCIAVENETMIALETFYADEMKEGKIDFTSLNLEEAEGKKIAGMLRVSGQALLVVRGEAQVNLISEGFMNARTNPVKFHEILKSHIDKLL